MSRELIARGGGDRARVRADDLLLGDGDHPAQERRRQRAEHRQLRAAARADRAARRRPLPGARAQQRAGRSHRRHLGEDEPRVPARRWARSSTSRRPSQARPRHRQDDRGDARGQGEGVRRRWAATSSAPTPDTTTPSEAIAALPADGADRDQAQSRPPDHRRAGADPPLPRAAPRRIVQASGEQFVTVEDTTGVVHSRAACCRRPRST